MALLDVAGLTAHYGSSQVLFGMDFAAECYRLGKLMPKAEEFRITSQLLRAAA